MSLDGFVGRLDGDVGFIFKSFDDPLTYSIVQDVWQAGLHIMGAKRPGGRPPMNPSPRR
jgi:hypothetical protein